MKPFLSSLRRSGLFTSAARVAGHRRWRGAYRLAIVLATCAALLVAPGAYALNLSVPYVNADTFWEAGYDGTGIVVGIIDGGYVSAGHGDYGGRVTRLAQFSTDTWAYSTHAMMCAGIVGSEDYYEYTGPGMAPDVTMWSGQVGTGGNAATAAEYFATTGWDSTTADVITMSLGFGSSNTGTDYLSAVFDHVVGSNGVTIVKSAGNDGPDAGTVTTPGGAYNVITVGATGADSSGNSTSDYSNIPDYSSRGETSDGRSKPDIVAPGSSITSTSRTATQWAFGTGDGTSFAAPHVAGAAALLVEMGEDKSYSTDPRLIKAVLLNSADKLTGWSHSSTNPLDTAQGAGQLDMEAAYYQYLPGEKDGGTIQGSSSVAADGWDMATVSGSGSMYYDLPGQLAAGTMLTATLVWNRLVTESGGTYSMYTLTNLNLYLYKKVDSVYTLVAYSGSSNDNVEHIYYSVGSTAFYSLRVRNLSGWSETFALAWEGTEIPEPGTVFLVLTFVGVAGGSRLRRRRGREKGKRAA